MYISYGNINIFLERFHLYFSSLETYTTVLRGSVSMYMIECLHSQKRYQYIFKNLGFLMLPRGGGTTFCMYYPVFPSFKGCLVYNYIILITLEAKTIREFSFSE